LHIKILRSQVQEITTIYYYYYYCSWFNVLLLQVDCASLLLIPKLSHFFLDGIDELIDFSVQCTIHSRVVVDYYSVAVNDSGINLGRNRKSVSFFQTNIRQKRLATYHNRSVHLHLIGEKQVI